MNYVLDRENYTKDELKRELKAMGWSVRGRHRTMWSKNKFRDLTLREAASLVGLSSCENLSEAQP